MSTPSVINQMGHRRNMVLCPCCEKGPVEMSVLGVWISPAHVLVCYYGVCEPCLQQGLKSEKEQRRLADKAELWLLAKYPDLAKKLPLGYDDGTAQSGSV